MNYCQGLCPSLLFHLALVIIQFQVQFGITLHE